MTKLDGWEIALDAVIVNARKTEFSWGANDCIAFTTRAVDAQSGYDPMNGIRGTYDTKLGAARALIAYCGDASVETAFDIVAAVHGWREIDPPRASRGSVVLIDDPLTGEPAVGIVALDGMMIIVPSPDGGVTEISLSQARRAWEL